MLASRRHGHAMHRRHHLGHSRRRKDAIRATILENPGFSTVNVPRSVTVRGPMGIADQCHLKLAWSESDSFTGSVPASATLEVNSIIYPGGPMSEPAAYVTAYSHFYNFYRVEAARVKLTVCNNSINQDLVAVVFPSIEPSLNIPSNIDTAIMQPDAKIMYVDCQTAGNPIRTIDYYMSFRKLWDTEYDQGPGFAAQMPSIPNATLGTSPATPIYFYVWFTVPNDSNSGTISMDWNIQIEFYTTLFGTVIQDEITLANNPKWLKDNPDYQPQPRADAPEGDGPPDPVFVPYLGKVVDVSKYWVPPTKPKNDDPPKPPDPETFKPVEDFVDLSKSDIQTLKSVLQKVK